LKLGLTRCTLGSNILPLEHIERALWQMTTRMAINRVSRGGQRAHATDTVLEEMTALSASPLDQLISRELITQVRQSLARLNPRIGTPCWRSTTMISLSKPSVSTLRRQLAPSNGVSTWRVNGYSKSWHGLRAPSRPMPRSAYIISVATRQAVGGPHPCLRSLNAGHQAHLIARARDEPRLLSVACIPLFGWL